MKTIYTIERQAQMTTQQAKVANRIEHIALLSAKLVAGLLISIATAFILVAVFIGIQEMPQRYEKAVSQYNEHQIKLDKIKTSSPNE